MTTSRTRLLFAFTCGCVTAALGGWLSSELRAQAPVDSAASLLHACASADGVLRVTPPRAACPSGQQSLFFQRAQMPPQQGDATPSSRDTTDARVKALEQRLAALERDAPTGVTHRVAAPFEIVDKGGHRVLLVDENHTVGLYNRAATDVVRLQADGAEGGQLVVRNGNGLGVFVGTSGTEASLAIAEKGVVRAELGRNPQGGHYRAVFKAPGGQFPVAGIGEDPDTHGGVAFISDKSGVDRAEMSINARGGQVVVGNTAKTIIASLTEGKTAGGLLEIMSSGGERMVVAGVQPGGFGVVQAGPASFMQAAGLGLPGSYIAGKAK